MKINRTKILATLIASFAVFAATFFALAESKNSNNLFLDTDQDGLTDQEEKMVGTDPKNSDSDSDGYSDGKEVKSGYNPLKPAPGDALVLNAAPSQPETQESEELDTTTAAQENNVADLLDESFLADSLDQLSQDQDLLNELSSDPENPNLTNEMVGSFLQLTLDKSETEGDDFMSNPTYSPEDFDQIVENALATTDISKNLPEIRDDEIKVLPPIDDKKLEPEEVKAKQKEEIEKYLASLAFIFATNSPFPVDEPENFLGSFESEQDTAIAAMTTGDQAKIDEYAQKARTAIDQTKKVEVPYVLKDLHKSALQLAIYTLDFKDDLTIDPNDPAKGLAALGSLQSVSESATKLQTELSSVLDHYGINSVELTK